MTNDQKMAEFLSSMAIAEQYGIATQVLDGQVSLTPKFRERLAECIEDCNGNVNQGIADAVTDFMPVSKEDRVLNTTTAFARVCNAVRVLVVTELKRYR